ncbi:pseudoazurin (plasmid) [Cereibacter azotoformans]|uniref:pseudoazurin n=1 Tax=Cereibacter azotoformans TaxID=43057 RepID=UPI001EEA8570|nr:pseudoazurin [Cereibacter azotoformans]ULB12376.1 pseudoazurin [Cereibacter azotoformans]
MKPATLLLAALLASPAWAETHEVRMFSRNDRGPMIYEPDRLRIAPGDAVRFLPAQPSHNAATIDGMIPAGAEPFKSRINDDFTVTLTVPGVYGIKCSPHFAMGMVMLIEVGEAPAPVLPDDLPARARDRFEAILARGEE